MRKPATKSNPAPTKAPTPVMAPSRFPLWLMAALLALGTIAVYWPAMRCDFINYDDPDYVTDNLHVQSGLNWEGVKWVFFNPVSANWHPLTMFSHMLDYQLFGLNPWGHHLTNVLFHSLNAALVFALLRQLTGATWRSLLVAALFAVHPLRVESVAWVAERKDVLSSFCGLLALIFYVRHAQKRSRAGGLVLDARSSTSDYLLALFFFALGLMSKPMLVTWPFVMLLLDYWPLERFKPGRVWRLVAEKIPFFVLAGAAGAETFAVQKHEGAVEAGEHLPFGAHIGNALISYCRYLGKMVWPTDMAVFYPHPGYWPRERVLLAGLLLCGITAVLFLKRRRYPFLLMGWLWFVGTLVPMIGLLQVGAQAMADRYTYLPSIGVLILAIWGAHELARRRRHHVMALAVAGCTAIVLCIVVTRQQLGYWKDSEILFRHALAVTENNYVAHDCLGIALVKQGQTVEGIRQYQEAIRLKPDYTEAHNNLGIVLNENGQIDEAIRQYQAAIRIRPHYHHVHYNLGIALDKKGQTDEAIGQYQEAIRLEPDYAEAHNNLGIVLDENGRIDEAIRQYQEAIRLKPGFAEAHNNLGNALVKNGQIDEAIRQSQEALRLEPDYPKAHYNLGTALFKKGRIDEAISQFQEAIHLKPDFAEAHNNLGNALGRNGQMDEAISQFQEAIRLKPDYAYAHNNLGIALGMKGRTNEAISQYQEAIRLKPDYLEARDNLARALAMTNTPANR